MFFKDAMSDYEMEVYYQVLIKEQDYFRIAKMIQRLERHNVKQRERNRQEGAKPRGEYTKPIQLYVQGQVLLADRNMEAGLPP